MSVLKWWQVYFGRFVWQQDWHLSLGDTILTNRCRSPGSWTQAHTLKLLLSLLLSWTSEQVHTHTLAHSILCSFKHTLPHVVSLLLSLLCSLHSHTFIYTHIHTLHIGSDTHAHFLLFVYLWWCGNIDLYGWTWVVRKQKGRERERVRKKQREAGLEGPHVRVFISIMSLTILSLALELIKKNIILLLLYSE